MGAWFAVFRSVVASGPGALPAPASGPLQPVCSCPAARAAPLVSSPRSRLCWAGAARSSPGPIALAGPRGRSLPAHPRGRSRCGFRPGFPVAARTSSSGRSIGGWRGSAGCHALRLPLVAGGRPAAGGLGGQGRARLRARAGGGVLRRRGCRRGLCGPRGRGWAPATPARGLRANLAALVSASLHGAGRLAGLCALPGRRCFARRVGCFLVGRWRSWGAAAGAAGCALPGCGSARRRYRAGGRPGRFRCGSAAAALVRVWALVVLRLGLLVLGGRCCRVRASDCRFPYRCACGFCARAAARPAFRAGVLGVRLRSLGPAWGLAVAGGGGPAVIANSNILLANIAMYARI